MFGSSDTSTLRPVHRLLEHYTPDGTLGRLLLGLGALGASAGLFFGGGLALLGGSLLEIAAGLATVGVGAGALFVGLATLWPVYLSLIGNVESPTDYPTTTSRRQSSVATRDAGPSMSAKPADDESPEAILKRRYAEGEIDDAEFERQLETILSAEATGDWDDEPTRRAARSRRERETEQAGN